jgi:phage baseplate assembly protein W
MATNYIYGTYSDLNQLAPLERELVYDVDAVFQSIGNILQTEKGERFFRPEFGSELGGFLFELNDAGTAAMVEKWIVDAIERWDTRLVLDYNRTSVDQNPDKYQMDLLLAFSIVGIPGTVSYRGVLKA